MSKNLIIQDDNHDNHNYNVDNMINSKNKAVDVLLIPDLLLFLDYQVVLYYRLICKGICHSMTENELCVQYWKAMCTSFAAANGKIAVFYDSVLLHFMLLLFPMVQPI